MNVILIPFFLAANIAVNDTSEWTFGPEYTYNVNMTYLLESDPAEPITNMQLISTIKCRPKMPNSLFCSLQNSTTTVFFNRRQWNNDIREIATEQIFEIKFNERGVESLLVELPARMEIVNFIRKIANQLSVGADMKRKISMPQFMTRENTSMGNCATMYKITREEPETDERVGREDTDFQLVVLPMLDAKPGTTLLIEKSRIGCINPPRYIDIATGILKMGRYFSKIQIGDIDRFETFTELDGKLRPPTESLSSRIVSFKGLLHVNLDSIKPAQDEISSILYGEPIELNMNIDIPTNMID